MMDQRHYLEGCDHVFLNNCPGYYTYVVCTSDFMLFDKRMLPALCNELVRCSSFWYVHKLIAE